MNVSHDRSLWLLYRHAFIDLTSSTLASAAGVKGSYKSRQAVWRCMCSPESEVFVSNFVKQLFKHGEKMEPIAAQAFGVHYPEFEVWNDGHLITKPFGAVNEYTLGGTPDGFVRHRETGAVVTGIEIKCPTRYYTKTDLPPRAHHVVQCLSYMYLTGASHWILYYYTERKTKAYVIKFDAEVFNTLLKRASDLLGLVRLKTAPPRAAPLTLPTARLLVWPAGGVGRWLKDALRNHHDGGDGEAQDEDKVL